MKYLPLVFSFCKSDWRYSAIEWEENRPEGLIDSVFFQSSASNVESYVLDNDYGGSFQIDTVGELNVGQTPKAQLRVLKPLDREINSNFNLKIIAIDEKGNNLDDTVLSLKITDLNDNAPKILPAEKKLFIDENMINSTVTKVEVLDPDEAEYGVKGIRFLEPKMLKVYKFDGTNETVRFGDAQRCL